MSSHEFCQSAVTRNPRRVFRALASACVGVDLENMQRKLQALAELLTLALKLRRGCLQSVVDMNRRDLAWPLASAGNEQSGGIRAAA